MGQAKLRGSYEQRKAAPKSPPRDMPRPVTVHPAGALLSALLRFRSKTVQAFSKKARREAAFLVREEKRAAKVLAERAADAEAVRRAYANAAKPAQRA